MEERYSFADSITGLTHAFNTSLNLRRHGFTTRLVTHSMTVGKMEPFVLHTIIATPPARHRAESEDSYENGQSR